MAPKYQYTVGDQPITINEWLVVGPFRLEDGQPDSGLDIRDSLNRDLARKHITRLIEEDFLGDEADHKPGKDKVVDYTGGEWRWQEYPGTTRNLVTGVVNFNAIFTQDAGTTVLPYRVAYAYCELENSAAEEREIQLSINSDDGAAIWLNGEQVWFNPTTRTMGTAVRFFVTLQPGVNRCLVKVANAIIDWQFALQVAPVSTEPVRRYDLGQVEGEICLRTADWRPGDVEQPLAGVQVSLTRQATLSDAPFTYVATSDQLGCYCFSKLAPGDYVLAFPSQLSRTDLGLQSGQLSLTLGQERRELTVPANSKLKANHVIYAEAFRGEVRGVIFRDQDSNGRRMGNEAGLFGVPVALFDQAGRQVAAKTSDQFGEYRFEYVEPGDYSLRFAQSHDARGEELSLSTPAVLPISVAAAAAVQAPPTGYQPEVHEIRGRIRYDDGTPAVGVIVRLMDAKGAVEIGRVVTNDDGRYRFEHVQGPYLLVFPEDPDADVLTTPARLAAQVNSIAWMPDTIYRLGGGGGSNGRSNGIGGGPLQDSLADIASYMPTTHESDGPAPRRTSGASGGGNLQQLVDGALTAVLGRRLKTDDPRLFRASLKRAFTLEQQNGRATYVWTPRSYAVQTELGGELTGAQASLYHRAKIALDDALPLLRGLEPLIPSPDREEAEAVRGIIRTQLSELVEELGTEGGPRVQRVDSLFQMLNGHFERMQQAFGFDDRYVNSVDEERRLTDFFVIRDYVRGLRTAWEGEEGFRRQFTGERRFLGTQLVLLSRALSVVAESVDEVYQAMDAVALGPAERQTVRIDFPTHVRLQNTTVPVIEHGPERGKRPPAQLIEELLSWVLRFATDEGRMLIEEGGRQGVMAMQPTARQLQLLVQGAAEAQVSHVGFSRTRVRRALNELAVQLGQVDRLARELTLRPA